MQTIESRNKWLAAFLSLLGAGLGHLYCGRLRKAVCLILIYIIATLTFDNLFSLSSSLGYYLSFLLIGVVFQTYCIIDSWLIAKRFRSSEIRWFNRWYVYFGMILLFVTVNVFGLPRMETKWRTFYSASVSMEPTLPLGERWYARIGTFQNGLPDRGKVIIFRNPQHPEQEWVRRLVGLPGDMIQLIDGQLHINGSRIERHQELQTKNGPIQYREVFPNDSSHLVLEHSDDKPSDQTDVYIVPNGHIFVLGDNRDRTKDSRNSELGTIPVENLIGTAEIIYWSNDMDRIGKTIN